MTIFIVDIIGKHSGAHFYNKSFMNVLSYNYKNIKIVSNYTEPPDEKPALFDDYYTGNFIYKIIKLLKSLFKYYHFIIRSRKNSFIFLSYGNAFEILFIWPLIFCKKKIIDIHEMTSLIIGNRVQHVIRAWYARILYNYITDAVISHSERTNSLLDRISYSGCRLEIPHFSYENDTKFVESEISAEVRSLISGNRINVLFFGFIRSSKGVDIIARLAETELNSEANPKLNFIIAGNDPNNLVRHLRKSHMNNSKALSLLLRYINDDELKYLFTLSDCVILPYKQISQSGVLEMAVRFRKPVITSSLDYFRDFFSRFPSFGIYCKSNSVEEYLDILTDFSSENSNFKEKFYSEQDLKKFIDYKNPEEFLNGLAKVLTA